MTTVGQRVTQWMIELSWTPATMLPKNGQRCWTVLSDERVAIHEFYSDLPHFGPSWLAVEKGDQDLYVGDDGLQVEWWQPYYVPMGPGEMKRPTCLFLSSAA